MKCINHLALLPIAFASESITSRAMCYSSKETDVLSILYGLEKFHHYSFADKEGRHISTISEYYINQGFNYSELISYPGTTMQQVKIQKYQVHWHNRDMHRYPGMSDSWWNKTGNPKGWTPQDIGLYSMVSHPQTVRCRKNYNYTDHSEMK